MTVSRKKDGTMVKSLFDMRSREILEKVIAADYIELEIFEKEIRAHICKIESVSACKTIDISDVVQCREVETVSISSELLAAGGEEYVQLSFFDLMNEVTHQKSIESIYKIVSLFSGAGMLDYPFKQDSKYKILLANDIGKGQAASYVANIGNMLVKKDIRELNIIPAADLVLGGPSCKPFSNCNRSTRLMNHPDYFLIKEYIRIVKQANPKVFVIENVPAFVTTADGMILEDIMNQLSNYEYSVTKLVDSDVGGYTTRKRVIIIGSKIGKIELTPSLSDAQNSKTGIFEFCNSAVNRKTAKEALDKVDATWFNYGDYSVSNEATQERMAYVRDGHNWEDVPAHLTVKSQFCNYMRRLSPDEPAPAIVNVRKSLIMPPKQYVTGKERCLSVAECSALMGFPKEFRFLGTLDERQQQVANGVPYMIAKLIKDSVTKALDGFGKLAMI